ncbi:MULTISPECIES: LysR family transcriptional regulator [Streptomyces]|uniref:LysR family transcriptional regulator n=2 Tax=Streptomyces TaxID=1883 RepID=A0A3M8F791_9ACTN|nr:MULTISPECIES: LysR family transcriptional regulator [Streptomyces]KNE79913.1 LysR family transcriptional regulator [Streptomyces fradiae]OFA42353.1 LysR family transcriptional regulator [Streptomyces fradiae]PQM22675.1 LysR family transcriptional regulator [Streptomyces xinghaiensis]RKM97844.1 LysR family transcriptional regulator [Streptomyces xinghaiensis]RNC74019.1 LysR family transcriptional regulator [Streptomyces xinghaiensis]
MPWDTDPRLLRAFAAVADELHFTRAAARLYVAQQALSRDIRRLEGVLGTELFVRTTRSVELTAAGKRLLPYARRVLEAHDDLIAACSEADADRPLLVDIGERVSTGNLVLEEARRIAPAAGPEFYASCHSGLTGAAADLLAGRLDVSFGRIAGLDPAVRARLDHLPVRYEPMAVVLPAAHRLAPLPAVPLDALAGETVYAAAGNDATAEWTGLAERLFAGRGIAVAPPLPPIRGRDEFTRVMGKLGRPVLATSQFIEMPGTVLRPLTDPVPLSPVAMVWRRGIRHPGLGLLRTAAAALAAEHAWLVKPSGSWLPEADQAAMSR